MRWKASTIFAWSNPGLMSFPQAFKASLAPTPAILILTLRQSSVTTRINFIYGANNLWLEVTSLRLVEIKIQDK